MSRAKDAARNTPHIGATPFGAVTERVRAFLMIAAGLTPEQADVISAAQVRARNMAWLGATATAWKVARKAGIQGLAERAHNAAFAAAAGDPNVREAAAFAVLPVILGSRLDPGVAATLRAPWEASLTEPETPAS